MSNAVRRPIDGGEVARGVLGVEAGLDRVAGAADVVLAGGQGLAGGDPELPFHQVEAGDRFGDRMLHLQAGVHLQEEEAVGVGDELHRSGADIAHRARGGDGGGAHGAPARADRDRGRGLPR